MSYCPPWFKWWPEKFLSDPDVMAMTGEQVGWYCLMLVMSWTNTPRGYITTDQQVLSLCCHCADPLFFSVEAKIVLRKFKMTEDKQFYYHPRILEQVGKPEQLIENKSKAGKASAEAKRIKRAQVCSSSVEQVLVEEEEEEEVDIKPKPLKGESVATPVQQVDASTLEVPPGRR